MEIASLPLLPPVVTIPSLQPYCPSLNASELLDICWATPLTTVLPDPIPSTERAVQLCSEGDLSAAREMIKGLAEAGVISGQQLANRCFKQGQQFVKRGHRELGEAAFWLALESDPELGKGHLSLAKLYLDLHRFGPAFRHAQMATELGIQSGKAVTGLVYQQFAAKLHSSSEAERSRPLTDCGKQMGGHGTLEETALWACEQAERHLLEAGESAARTWIVHATLLQESDPAAAWDFAYRACRADNSPDHHPLLAYLTSRYALLLQDEEQHEEAVKVCQRVQTLFPKSVDVKTAVLQAQMVCYGVRGMYADGAHFARKLWQMSGDEGDLSDYVSYAKLGAQQRLKASRYEEALRLLVMAEEAAPDDSDLARRQVVLFEKWGEHCVERGSQIKGKSRHDLKKWGHIRRGAADDLRAQLRGPPPKNTKGLWSDRLDQAAGDVKLSPRNPEALEHYAQAYRSLGARLVDGEVPDELMWEIVPYLGEFFDPKMAGIYAFEEAERILPAEENRHALSHLGGEQAWSVSLSAFLRKPQSALRREWLKRNGIAYVKQLFDAGDRQGAREVLLQAYEVYPEDETIEQMSLSLHIQLPTPIPYKTRAILT
jgi:tetratricopeptide (TPR) repeat protein